MFNLLQIPVYSMKFPQFYTFIPDRTLFQSGGPLYLIDPPLLIISPRGSGVHFNKRDSIVGDLTQSAYNIVSYLAGHRFSPIVTSQLNRTWISL